MAIIKMFPVEIKVCINRGCKNNDVKLNISHVFNRIINLKFNNMNLTDFII